MFNFVSRKNRKKFIRLGWEIAGLDARVKALEHINNGMLDQVERLEQDLAQEEVMREACEAELKKLGEAIAYLITHAKGYV